MPKALRSLFSFTALLTGALALLASPAKADWYKAESENFVIYADDSPKDIRRFSEIKMKLCRGKIGVHRGSIFLPKRT